MRSTREFQPVAKEQQLCCSVHHLNSRIHVEGGRLPRHKSLEQVACCVGRTCAAEQVPQPGIV